MRRNLCYIVCLLMLLCASAISGNAAEVVYRIVDYNKTTGEFTLAASGIVPKDAWAYFENDYGATTGNRYNQIPRNRKASLYLEGWQGCTMKKITLSMCSNNKSGQMGLEVKDGDNSLYRQRPADFCSSEWFDHWVSKDLNVYVDLVRQLDISSFSANEACIDIQGGTAEGSVYLNAITIEYDTPTDMALESPLGWSYTKLAKKSTLHDGDEVIIYRNGCAATDIDGMQTSHYLDAVAIASTSDVATHDVLLFTLRKADDADKWTMTDQYGRRLTATGKQHLAWDEGSDLWTIDLGYDGATIANGSYGSLRYNTPENSYARFNIYTSNTLPLPYLYVKDKQNEPIISRSLTFDEANVEVTLDKAYIALTPSLLPASTTDQRLLWTSSNEAVCTVNGGFVSLKAEGKATITAKTMDGGAEATVNITVMPASGIVSITNAAKAKKAYKMIEGKKVVVVGCNGEKYRI